jgi:hypothetical protein
MYCKLQGADHGTNFQEHRVQTHGPWSTYIMFISLHTEKLLVPELNNSFLLLQKRINFEIFVLLGYDTVPLDV